MRAKIDARGSADSIRRSSGGMKHRLAFLCCVLLVGTGNFGRSAVALGSSSSVGTVPSQAFLKPAPAQRESIRCSHAVLGCRQDIFDIKGLRGFREPAHQDAARLDTGPMRDVLLDLRGGGGCEVDAPSLKTGTGNLHARRNVVTSPYEVGSVV